VRPSYVSGDAVPICADVTAFNWEQLVKKQLEVGQRHFDVIMMDPPWKLSTSQPSRGVAIQYDSLSDDWIERLPVPKLQKSGVLIIWAINAKYAFTVRLMSQWGYRIVDSITWVKKTINGKIAKGHGYYLQHAKETCLIGVKGDTSVLQQGVARDVIFSDRRGQSQKPEEIYDYIEQLVPNGYYLEVFGRRNNLRDKWVTIGNEI
jgi:mRNA m6A methyltransferase catalytic subunit